MIRYSANDYRDAIKQRDDAREGQRQLGLELDSVRRAAQRRGFVIAFLACGVGFSLYALTTWLLR